MKTGIILLARIGSSRLPGKVMLDLCGKPVLEQIICRLKKIKLAEELVVATTVNTKDNAIVSLCEHLGVSYYRGSEENVLDRCIQAAEAYDLDVIVRLGADTPFIDWEIIEDMLRLFFFEYENGNHLEYLSNNLKRSFPLGLDADVMTRNAFVRIDLETKSCSPEERKSNEINVIPYLHQNLNKFCTLSYHKDYDYSHLRWTLDTPEDFILIKKIYESLYPENPDFLMRDILDLLQKYPEWSQINSKIVPKSGYWTESERSKLSNRMNKLG